MPLIVEDGTGVVGANSYVSVEFADSYFAGHVYYADQWAALDPLKKENLLSAASRTLDQLFNWYGYRTFAEQELAWPRQYVYVSDRSAYLDNQTIPLALKEATCEMAYHVSKGDAFKSTGTEGIESLRIDVIELQFKGSSKVRPLPAPALLLLKPLGEYAFGRGYRKVIA